MALIFVSGNSGSGKTTVRKKLEELGHEAHDTDENGLSSWVNRKSGQKVKRPDNIYDRTNDFYVNHDWMISKDGLLRLKERSQQKNIFLCGSIFNDQDVFEVADIVVFLDIDKDSLIYRLKTRTDNDFGKSPDELNNILGWHDYFREKYAQQHAIMIDATQDVNTIVKAIISAQ